MNQHTEYDLVQLGKVSDILTALLQYRFCRCDFEHSFNISSKKKSFSNSEFFLEYFFS